MRSLLTSTTAQLAASIVTMLGLAPLAACDSDVETVAQGGGGSGGSSSSIPTTTGGGAYPDHPPTCEELSTSATGGSGTTTGTVGPGAGGDDGAGGAGGGGGDDSTYARPCENPTPVMAGCLDTGVDQCDGGFLVRREPVACPGWHRPASEFSCTASPDMSEVGCTVDADCGAGAQCDQYFAGAPAGDACSCVTTCEADADCATGELCLCGEGGGRCVTATCRSDADCGPGLRCASMDTGGCNPTVQFHCQTPGDACITSSECMADGIGDPGCVVDASGARICETGHGCAAVGRPLIVEGAMRVAPLAHRRDWTEASAAAAPEGEVRAAVAAGWAHVGAMEHASVASFARFALDLLALGAPPGLVAAASQAMLDEIEHARLAYGLATAVGGAPVGPGSLDVSGAVGAVDLVELAVATFVEGCIGEGAASAEAAIGASSARDPEVAAVLHRVAREEATHAELGWKTIAWALERDPARVAPALEAALARAEAAPPAAGREPGLEAWGLVGPAERAAIRAETLRAVVRPVLAQLLARVATAEAARQPPSAPSIALAIAS